jgi:glycosyltransferase involved in cell wall biosynthesis
MKILLLNQAFYPDSVATSQYVTDIARFLAARGHEVSVLCGRRDYTERETIYPAYEEHQGIRIHRVSSTGFGKRSFVGRAADIVSHELSTVWKLLRLPRQDVVLAFTSPPLAGVEGALISRLWGARFLHWIMNVNHEVAIEMGHLRRDGPLARALTELYRFTLAESERVVVMDRWMCARAMAAAGLDPARVAVVPLWPVHEPHARDEAEHNPFREKYGLDGKFVIVHSGNLSHIHPLNTVLDAAVRLRDDPSVVFAFFGYGARARDIDEHVRRHGLGNVLELPYQPREALADSLGLADLQLVVMGDATSGLAHSSKIYSILATGRPYLFIGPRDSHIVGDILEKCPFGHHIQHGDVEGFLRVVELVKKLSPEARAEYRRRNVAFVRSEFDRERLLTDFAASVLEGT